MVSLAVHASFSETDSSLNQLICVCLIREAYRVTVLSASQTDLCQRPLVDEIVFEAQFNIRELSRRVFVIHYIKQLALSAELFIFSLTHTREEHFCGMAFCRAAKFNQKF